MVWAISPTPLCFSLAWNTLTGEPGRGKGLEGQVAEVKKRVTLVPVCWELQATMAVEKQRSVSLKILWIHTPGQN